MMSMTRRGVEILLDTPDTHEYVVSAYADMTVKDGFYRHVDQEIRNGARAAEAALSKAKARKDLDANIEVIRQAVQTADPAARGLAVFSCVARSYRHVIPMDAPVENRLVIDEEPFLYPLLVRWVGVPIHLIALADSHEAHLFEAHQGRPEPVRDLRDEAVDDDFQRDRPRFTYKKRFAKSQHERLHAIEDSHFFKEVVQAIDEHWQGGPFAGLVLLGQPTITGALRRLLPRSLEEAIVGEASHAMTAKPEGLADDVGRVIARWRADREEALLTELRSRWKENHRVANGASDVLDALQQGRATQILLSNHHDLPGARCVDCNYRFGAPVGTCPYCHGRCRSVSAAQDILVMAMRHRIPVHLFQRSPKDDPLAGVGRVAALLRAEADWTPHAPQARSNGTH